MSVPPRSYRKSLPPYLSHLLGVMLLLLLWELASLAAGPFIVPPPWQTIFDLGVLLTRGHTWLQLIITCLRVATGFIFAFFTGTVVGILAGIVPEVEEFIKPAILFLQGIPPLLWTIPIILLLGIGHLSPILVIALICFPLVTVNISEGMKTLSPQLEEMLKVFAPGFPAKLREIIVPHLKPFFNVAFKLGVILGIKASVVGEYFGANNGIGFQIQASYQSMQVRRLFAWGLLLVFLIVLTKQILPSSVSSRAGVSRRPSRKKREKLDLGEMASLKASLTARSSGATISVEEVGFSYQGTGMLLQDINLLVREDEIAVISGESGVGKTTFLLLIAGLIIAESGSIHRPKRLGLVFQDDRLIPWRSNAWNVALPLVYDGHRRSESLAFASYLLKETGLKDQDRSFPSELSGGMKKRVTFARCFARFPEAILLDEPFVGLDPDTRRRLWVKFMDLIDTTNVPVIVVTHFPEEVPRSRSCRFFRLEKAVTGTFPATLVPGQSIHRSLSEDRGP